jgi:hypothetical protein
MPSQSKDLKGKTNFNPGKPMSQNLKLLRQNYCRPATVESKRTPYLFALEKECEQGKALLANSPKTLLHLQKFNPNGLLQTYRDETTGAELPIFAVFDLEGSHQVAYDITMDSGPATARPRSLPAYVPIQKTQDFVRKINEPRMKGERAAIRTSAILGIFPVLAYLFSHTTVLTGPSVFFILLGGWILGAFLTYLLSEMLLNRICPWKKLVITAEFDGILPKATRERARAAKDSFDNLYLIVDQQRRWKSTLLRDPTPRALDPLLIGELKQGRRHQFFLIDQFDLTEAERYLADEFATKQDETSFGLPTSEI